MPDSYPPMTTTSLPRNRPSHVCLNCEGTALRLESAAHLLNADTGTRPCPYDVPAGQCSVLFLCVVFPQQCDIDLKATLVCRQSQDALL